MFLLNQNKLHRKS